MRRLSVKKQVRHKIKKLKYNSQQLESLKINKIILPHFDMKWFILDNGVVFYM